MDSLSTEEYTGLNIGTDNFRPSKLEEKFSAEDQDDITCSETASLNSLDTMPSPSCPSIPADSPYVSTPKFKQRATDNPLKTTISTDLEETLAIGGMDILVQQISQLENLVCGMRFSLGQVLGQLTEIQGSDRALSLRINQLEAKTDQLTADSTAAGLNSRSELDRILSKVQALDTKQTNMQNTVDIVVRQLNTVNDSHSGRGRTNKFVTKSKSADLIGDSSLAAFCLGQREMPRAGGTSSSVTLSDKDSGVNTATTTAANAASNAGYVTASDSESATGRESDAASSEQGNAGTKNQAIGSPEDGYESDASDTVLNCSTYLSKALRNEYNLAVLALKDRTVVAYESDDESWNEQQIAQLSSAEKSSYYYDSSPTEDQPGKVSQEYPSSEEDNQTEANKPADTSEENREAARTAERQAKLNSEKIEILLELLTTERQYCNGLWNLKENVFDPLRISNLVPAEDLRRMFPEMLFSIYEQHYILLQKLEDRLVRESANRVGAVVDLYSMMFNPNGLVYALYLGFVSACPTINRMVDKYFERSEKVKKFFSRQRRLMTFRSSRMRKVDHFSVAAFLITPIQKIPKYMLLFQRLMKCTAEECSDRRIVEKLVEIFQKLGSDMNSQLEKMLMHLDGNHEPPPVRPRRKHSEPTVHIPDTSQGMAFYDAGHELAAALENHRQSAAVFEAQTPARQANSSFYDRSTLCSRPNSLVRSRSSCFNSAAAIIKRSSWKQTSVKQRADQTDCPAISVDQPTSEADKETTYVVEEIRKRSGVADLGQASVNGQDYGEITVELPYEEMAGRMDLTLNTLHCATSEPALFTPCQQPSDFTGFQYNANSDGKLARTSTPMPSENSQQPLRRNNSQFVGRSGNPEGMRGLLYPSSSERDFYSRPPSEVQWPEGSKKGRGYMQKRKNAVVKNVNALRNSVAAFFSKRKNSKRFKGVAGLTGSMSTNDLYPSHVDSRPFPYSSTMDAFERYKREEDPTHETPRTISRMEGTSKMCQDSESSEKISSTRVPPWRKKRRPTILEESNLEERK